MNREVDPRLQALIKAEHQRENQDLELIASENYTSPAVLAVTGTILTNKYAEGYPGHRYYGGCGVIDQVEQLAIDLAKTVFQAEHANVQPHSGSQANAAAYQALLQPNDTVLSMSLRAGGHLTHGAKVNFSGREYHFEHYTVNPQTDELDYDAILAKAKAVKPKLIVAGASAYARAIDFKRFRAIADAVGAYLMVDMAHIAGLVAANLHQNPVPYADVVTSTTHKTLRGPRGGLILCKREFATAIDKAVFPGQQGGPLEHVIAAKAQALIEAQTASFNQYQAQVIANAKAFSNALINHKVKVLTGGTDNHMVLVDVAASFNCSGAEAEQWLQQARIIVNKNLIPFDPTSAQVTSGLRMGTPALTTRGFKEHEFQLLADLIVKILKSPTPTTIKAVKAEVAKLAAQFPIY